MCNVHAILQSWTLFIGQVYCKAVKLVYLNSDLEVNWERRWAYLFFLHCNVLWWLEKLMTVYLHQVDTDANMCLLQSLSSVHIYIWPICTVDRGCKAGMVAKTDCRKWPTPSPSPNPPGLCMIAKLFFNISISIMGSAKVQHIKWKCFFFFISSFLDDEISRRNLALISFNIISSSLKGQTWRR